MKKVKKYAAKAARAPTNIVSGGTSEGYSDRYGTVRLSSRETRTTPSVTRSVEAALRLAKQMHAEGVSWVEANNRLYGVGGLLAQLSERERTAFFETKEAAEITEILEQLPEPKAQVGRPRSDLNGKILARVPKSIHAALLAEAEAEGVSLNQLIVSKLSVQLRAAI
ncbi:MAG: toxin-antitoxin system HicB family antitoxin [Pirellulales bacterium]